MPFDILAHRGCACVCVCVWERHDTSTDLEELALFQFRCRSSNALPKGSSSIVEWKTKHLLTDELNHWLPVFGLYCPTTINLTNYI